MNSLESEGHVAGMSVISRDRLEDSESESEISLMQEISNTVNETNTKAGEADVLEVEDVEKFVEITVDLDDEASDQEGGEQQALHIDLRGQHDKILLDKEVAMETTKEDNYENIIDQDTESEDHESTVTSETLRTSPRFY